MNNIISIAKNTFKETIRDRILYAIIAFGLMFLIFTIFLGSISLGENVKVVKDLGQAGIYLFSLIITIFIGTSIIYKEIDKKTLYIILSKPVSTTQFITGKFLGLITSVSLTSLLMTVVYLIIVAKTGGGFDKGAPWSTLLLLAELSIFTSLSLFFSVLTTPLAGTIYSIIMLYIGHSLSLLLHYAESSGRFVTTLAKLIYYLLPNLEKFNIRNTVVYGTLPSSAQIIYPLIYSFCYTAILLSLANLLLKKREV